MPLYDYQCEACGGFSEFASVACSSEPANCPECGRTSARVISAPALALMPNHLRQAYFRSEKSAHEPNKFSKNRRGCGCQGAHSCGNSKPEKQVTKTAASARRPWMLGH